MQCVCVRSLTRGAVVFRSGYALDSNQTLAILTDLWSGSGDEPFSAILLLHDRVNRHEKN